MAQSHRPQNKRFDSLIHSFIGSLNLLLGPGLKVFALSASTGRRKHPPLAMEPKVSSGNDGFLSVPFCTIPKKRVILIDSLNVPLNYAWEIHHFR